MMYSTGYTRWNQWLSSALQGAAGEFVFIQSYFCLGCGIVQWTLVKDIWVWAIFFVVAFIQVHGSSYRF
ncbi:uncharacterized protein BJ212DRAFT_1403864 [Suillus subaureus]|uniref:Uncharacterized protein n=1 Tax=Suillus subaureus TaxID=48587 RepID=A0A9P7DM80_9AGAM|nr:uncharacterized protein BJ212DRAFT_1403864 [Suillus subaureus]KAG1798329.1 hypothetical protein BJ212DRAFT_1403864 [Suillus subaureus]